MVRRAPALIELEAFQLSLPTQSGMRSFCRQLQVSPVELLYSMVPAHGPVKGGPGPVGAKAFEVVVGGGIATADVVRRLDLESPETMTQKLQASWECCPFSLTSPFWGFRGFPGC